MNHVLTFVASKPPLTDAHIRQARETAKFYNITPIGTPAWLAKKKAAEIVIPQKPPGPLLTHLRDELKNDAIDVFTLPTENRRKKLLLADMESTIVDKEALDELAAFAGIKDKIAAITQSAMEGKLDFKAALFERIGLLKDLPTGALQTVLGSMSLNPGAKQLVATMKKHGATCVIVSGGFTFFTEPVAKQAGFDYHHGNTLVIENGKLAGKVTEPVLDKFAKLDFLKSYVKQLGLTHDDVMAIGDGANDIPMLKAAGLGVGYQPKEVVAKEINNLVIHGDLAAPLYIQGFRDSDLA
jgi:phosphoserine phosphatase